MSKKKNPKWHRLRHDIICNSARPFFKVFLRMKEKFIFERTKDLIKGPAIVIANHLTVYDPIKVGLNMDETAYYVMGDDIYNRRVLGSMLKWAAEPIPKSKSVSDIKCVRSIMKVLKEGYKVVLFPEGNRSYSGGPVNIDKSIGKLIKATNVPLVIYNLVGGFLADPRWANKIGKAENHAVLRKVITKEELSSMSIEEIHDVIVENLRTNQNEYNDNHRENRAEYMERFLYYCPDCNKFSTIRSEKNNVICDNCGYELEYNKDATFTLLKGSKSVKDLIEWDKLQRKALISTNPFDNDGVIFEDNEVTLFTLRRFKSKKPIVENGHLTMTNKEIKIDNGNESMIIPLDKILSTCVLMRNKANIYIDDNQYQLKGFDRFNALKYVNMFYHIKNILNNENFQDEFLGI